MCMRVSVCGCVHGSVRAATRGVRSPEAGVVRQLNRLILVPEIILRSLEKDEFLTIVPFPPAWLLCSSAHSSREYLH